MSGLNVLLVSYSFPPAGGVGVLRASSLARYLPAEGIRLDVLTTHNASAVGSDSGLLKEIPGEVEIHRTITFDLPFGLKKGIKKLITGGKPSAKASTAAPAGGKGSMASPAAKPSFVKKAIQDLLLPDPQVTWLPALTRAARRIVRERKIDLVLITVPPFSSVLLVERLRKDFPQLAIVVDFRDEWLSTTIDLVSFSRSERAMRIAREAEASAVKNATAIVAVTEAARREIRARYPEQPEEKFLLVPNGFDATRVRAGIAPADRSSDKIVATYVGTVYGSTEPTTLVEAMQALPPEVKSRFKLRFIGHIEEPRYREALLQLGDMVELKGFLPQGEALALMNETDYVLLVTHDPLNVAAKFYDYVGSGKPILATVHPQGDVRRLLENLRAGWWADSRDVKAICKLFVEAAARGDSLLSTFQPDREKIAQYERKPLAQRYAALLHSIAGKAREPEAELAREAS
jgi:glycosyltransferase involved in cell wall biosynthesis